MRLKLLLITIALFLVCGGSYGQLLQWNTFGNTGTETTESSVANDVNIAASDLTQGTITPAGNANRFGGSGWWNTGDSASNTLVQAVAGNDYIQFIVTPNSGYSFTPTSFVFNWDKSGTGPQNVVLRSSVDGFTADLGTVAPTAAIAISNTIIISGLTNITTATTFRLYGYGATATGGTGGFDIGTNVVNVQLNGTTAAATPTQLVLVSAPSIGTTGTPLSSFTVEGRNAGNVLVTSFTGTVTLTKASGTGTMGGTLSANAVAGVATFNNVAFDQASTYTITAASAGLTSATSGNVVVSNPATNVSGGDGVNFVGQINGYSQPINCTYGDYRVLKYRKVNTTASAPTDGRGQWVNTVNVQASGGDVTPLNMGGGGGAGFLFTSGGGCGATGTYANKWAFGGVGQGAVDAINGATFNGLTDMGFNMGTAGRYTFVLKDNGYNGTGYYVGYTTNTPVTMTHNTGTQRTLNPNGTATITATISAANSPQENFYVRYKTGSNDFSTLPSTISAVGSVVGTIVTFTIPVQADGTVVYYYIFSSTMSQVALSALSEGDKSYALLNYADNSGSNYSYNALSLTPTVTSIVPTAVTGITGQANNTGFKGQTITINGANFQSDATVTINGVLATSVTFVDSTKLTAVVANTGANFTGNVVVANPTPATSVTVPSFNFLGYITTSNGSLNTTGNWLGGTVPLSNSTITLAHNQTLAAVTTNTPFAAMTILTGITMDINGASGVLTITGAITTVGTGILTFSAGGSVTSGSIVNAGTISFGSGASNANLITGGITNSGTMSWTTAGTLTINAGGTFTNTGTVTSGTVGNVVFAGAGTINGTNAITFNNLTINSTTTLATIPTINGTLQLNSGSSVTATPTYGGSSTLVYNTTGTYGVSNEWTGNSTTAGSGIPNNVTIQNNTTLTMPSTNRGMAGSLNISSGNLTLNATSGDLYLAGSWTRASAASFTPNNRAVFFNGSTTQTVTVTATGTETFNFLLVQGSGTLQLAAGTAINVTASSGLSLSSSNVTSTIDLNRQTLTLSGGGNLNLNGGSRFITSSAGTGGVFRITSATTTVTNGGALSFAVTNTTVDLQTGLDCGTGSLVTINGTLQINANGFCLGNSPRYGASSLLQYNSGANPYNRQLEWTSGISAIGTIGLPQNVQISNNTTLNYINAGNSGAKGIAGNLTIDSGSSLIMNYGSVSSAGALTVSGNLTNAGTLILGQLSGDDLRLGGNFNNTGGNFNGFDRAIFFIRSATGTQLITAPAGITIPYIVIQPAAGTNTVQLAAGTNLTISAPLAGIALTFTNTTDIFDINSNTLTIGTTGVDNKITGLGTFKGSTTSNLTILGTGSIGTLKFANDLNLGTFIMNREAATVGCTMASAVTINTALNLTNGLISLGNFDMSLGLTATHTGSANGFVISDPDVGIGMLTKRASTFGPYTLHIGENTAPNGAQYAPATINFSSGTFSPLAYYGVQVKDAIHPNIDSSTDYLTKYWIITSSGTFTLPVYSFTGLYNSGAADVNGTESKCISAKWDGTKWTNGEAIGGGTLTISGLTTMATSTTNEISAGNRNREINIKGLTGGTNDIVSGSPTANGLNNTLFLAANLGSSTTKDFEIQNLGIAALNLTGTPLVSIGGTNPGDFSVTTVPSTSIIGGSSTSFIIKFSPTYAGIRTAIVSIANDDSTDSENPYTFLIQGTGTCSTTTNNITPTSGPVGTEVTITAIANDLTGATASFNGTNSTIVSSTASKLVVLVPSGATSGNLVTTNAQGCQATNTFTVIDNKANSCEGGNTVSDLFISEVTDATTGGLSYIEIYNGTSSAINMNGYSLFTSFNGGANPTTLPLNNAILAPGSTFVVAIGITASPNTSNTCSINGGNGSLANQTSTNTSINFDPGGNDYIGLLKNSTASIIDSFGKSIDATWADGLGLDDRGATFRRKNTAPLVQPITFSNSDWNITDWVGNAQASCYTNDYSDIGVYNFISGTPPTVKTDPSYTWDCKLATSLTVVGTEGYPNENPLAYQWLVSAPGDPGWTEITSTTNGSIYTNFNSATLNISNISNVLNYQYYCQIRENTDSCYKASKAVKITDGGSTTWNGAWSNGAPTIDKLVIINADYNTSINSSFSACSVVVNTGKTLTITADEYVKIQNDLTNNGTLIIENDGSLVQVNDDAVNTGNISYERITPPIISTDYTYWSSPVSPQTLYNVSPTTLAGMFYSYDDTVQNWLQVASSNNMIEGKGYIIRGPEQPFQNPYTATFIGKPNNGVYSISGVDLDRSYLLGNPYPSALDADTFLTNNAGVLDGTLYFWTHNTPIGPNVADPGTGAYAYSGYDYASYNFTGGAGTGIGNTIPGTPPTENTANKPTGKIASGQGFFASSKTSALTGSSIIFNNSMRVGVGGITGNNTQFFKTKNTKEKTTKTIEKHRIWLNMTNTQGAFKQTLVGYITDATNEYDSRFDGESFDANEFVDFYSLNQDKNLVIQGRALPFNENDEVPLGFRTTIEGPFTINIDQVDGVLTNHAVFIEDKLTNTVFDLKTGNYTFNTVAGTFNDRFILRYTNKALSNKDFETLENQVLVSNKNKQIKVNSAVETIDKVTVYDLLGRQLFKKEKVNSNELTLTNLVSSQQTLLVKVSLQNGQTVTKKIMY